MTERLVVIGGDAAGMTTASQARRRRSAQDLEIIALERSNWASYSACGEPYYVAGYVDTLERLVARTPEQFAQADIDVRLRHEATAIDLDRRKVSVHNLETGDRTNLGFDQLMIATGARPFKPPISGMDLPGVYGLHTLDDAAVLRDAVETGPGNAVVVGGGYVGLEVAEALSITGWKVTVLTSGDAVLDRTLDPDLGKEVVKGLESRGIRVVTNTRVMCINGENRVESVGCEDETHPAEIVLLGLGFRPETDLAGQAGVPLGKTGAVAVNDRQQTKVEGVWSAGDCAEATHRLTGQPVNFHLGTVANKAGRVAGINIGGGDARFPGVLGTAITKVCDLEISSTGLRAEDAAQAGLDAVTGDAQGTTTAGYWPEAAPMTIRVTAQRGTGRILGAQVVGGPGAGKRIDVFATAIWNEMTAPDLSWVDLSYAPPFSGVWDLVAIAARRAGDAARV